jgi:hypothetical protein
MRAIIAVPLPGLTVLTLFIRAVVALTLTILAAIPPDRSAARARPEGLCEASARGSTASGGLGFRTNRVVRSRLSDVDPGGARRGQHAAA